MALLKKLILLLAAFCVVLLTSSGIVATNQQTKPHIRPNDYTGPPDTYDCPGCYGGNGRRFGAKGVHDTEKDGPKSL
ncbi:hypothetical protein K7X08_000205 [Anisodus acutangulus]|uniref:Uncharacterized protein n=1 Tax=Anisodus acutangulus TaxID=402998 RepID=A0A9Q1M4F1_9SOLA|nr:hypothetical protein K7X08_000205 [Anisodus acutangulus]